MTPAAGSPTPSRSRTATHTPTSSQTPASALPTLTPTPAHTPTPTLPGATVTPMVVADTLAGGTAVVVNAMGLFPNLVAAIANGIEFGAGAGLAEPPEGGAARACPENGFAFRSGSLTAFPPNLSIQLTMCEVPTADGTVVFEGNAGVIGFGLMLTVNIDMHFKDTGGNEILQGNVTIIGSAAGIPDFGGSCQIRSLAVRVTTGSLTVMPPGGPQVGVSFQNSTLAISNITFSPNCIPLMYRLTFNGPAALLNSAGDPIDVTFNALTVDVDDSSDPTTFKLGGGMTSTCFGGTAMLTTPEPELLEVHKGENCPRAGRISVNTNVADLYYRSDQMVHIDDGADGDIDRLFPNCYDPRLFECM